MTDFNFKSLGFYGITIVSVLILFKVVTAYGENNLQPPAAISPLYLLTLAEKLPNCEKSNTLRLNIQQSGVYLNAALSSENSQINTEETLSLTGIIKNQQLNIAGKVDQSIFCNLSKSPNESISSISIQISLANKGSYSGKLNIGGISQPIEFIAVPQSEQRSSPKVK
jgi:hypothetical protein